MKCGEEYRLEKVVKAPRAPAAWFHQGTAFHTAVEFWENSGRTATLDEVLAVYHVEYDRLIAEDRERVPDLNRWLTGGRVKAADDIQRRRARGADQVQVYIRYAEQAPERLWMIGGNTPAVEVEFELDLDGVIVKGFIDQLVEWPTGQVGPRDLKTGSKRPDWALQLGVYALATEDLFGYLPTWGDFYIAKDGRPDRPIDLSTFTRERVSRWFRDMDVGVQAGLYLPNVGDHCRVCGVSEFCSAIGSRAHEYPPTPLEVSSE